MTSMPASPSNKKLNLFNSAHFTFAHAKSLTTLAMVSLLSLSMSASALPSDANQPIKLTADKATYKADAGVMTYSGNVSITQGTLKIAASNISINLADNNKINSIIATGGPATMQQVVTKEKGLTKAQAGKIDYNANNGIITLTSNAKLTQNGASFAGNVIRYSLKAGDVEATSGGSQRVEIVFPPNGNTNLKSIR